MELIEKPGLGNMELISSWYPQGIASKNKQEIARRDEQIATLLSHFHDNPAYIQALLQQRDYGLPDQQDFYFELRTLLTEALDQVDTSGEHLLEVALAHDTSWYVRRQAVYLIKARQNKQLVARLIPLLTESGLQGEIRATAATTLAQNGVELAQPILLSLYQALPKGDDYRLAGWTYAEADLLEALGYFGAPEILRPLIVLQYHSYRSRRLSGQRGMEALVARNGGLAAVLDLLDKDTRGDVQTKLAMLANHDQSEAVRRWAIEQLGSYVNAQSIRTLCEGLNDSSWMAANAAAEQLISLDEPPFQNLEAMFANTALSPSARLWAAYVLFRRGKKVDDSRLAAVLGYPIALPEIVSPALRQAVLQCWVPNSEPGTDVRWLVEEQTLPALQPVEPPFKELILALKTHGLQVRGPLYCAELYQQGRGTFYVVQSRTAHQNKIYFYTLFISLLGPFASLDVLTSEDESSESVNIPFNRLGPEETEKAYRAAVAAVGLTWIEDQALEYIFPGLNVYYFGNREELSLDNLLYYWQD